MTSKNKHYPYDKIVHTLEEICQNTRSIHRVVNRILDLLGEYREQQEEGSDLDTLSWRDLQDYEEGLY